MRWRELSRWLSFLFPALLFPLPLMAASTVEHSARHLERVVIVSRHGVRAPTKMPALIREVTPDAWPAWPVPLGDITPRGESLVSLLGAYYRQQLSQEGLLPAQGCPPAGWVYAWTDVDQRTRKTGAAFLQGLAPRCAIAIHHRPDVSPRDPLFHPVKAGVCRLDKARARRAIEAQAGMSLAVLNRRYGAALAQMDETLRFASSPYCQRRRGDGACTLAQTMPTRLHIGTHGAIALRGAVGLSATLAEMFLLQQAQGMAQPAWGRIATTAQWRSLLQLHNLQFDLLSRTDDIARHRGTPLMYTVLQALNGQTPRLPGLTAQNRLLLLVGHDTNLANLSGMLQTPWSLPEQPDNTPPGGELRFERWGDSAGRAWVRVSVVYQSLAQLRQQTRLALQAPPHQVILTLPGCRGGTADGFCPLDVFSRWLSSRLIPACLPASADVTGAMQ
ncbi:AppA family phytase/histidine-type acid phosphatase [Edwardsiella anguillarum]|uniref:AppA family phytase/histidine-type acid phosphatase n=1 Tax=Edwardsiella anguillarum TaxID=1821960 RepID=UPI001FD65B86|nr:AppA family phytase/histidine-type acid phosphatase [Edwardsiella anguillarum]UOU80482.1 AppA family phytase/histidine-type acid phosphatase [Edwardsiella anguillarum]